MQQPLKGTFCLVCFMFFLNLSLLAESKTIPLHTQSQDKFYIENQFIEFYQDTSNLLSYKDVITNQFDSLFSHPNNLSITRIKTNIWFRFEVENQSEQIGQWILAVPDFTHIDVFLADQSGNIVVLKAGTKLPVSKKQLKNGMWEIISFSLKGDEKKTVYVKTISDVALKIQNLFMIYDVHRYYLELNIHNLIQGVFNGLLLIMFFYNLFLFFMTRQKSYLYYSLYILCIATSILSLVQFITYFIFPENPEIDFYFGFFIFFAYIFYFLFMREFIDLKQNNLKLDKFLKTLAKANLIFALTIIAVSFFNYFMYALLSILFFIANMVILLVLVLKVIKKSNKITRIFAFGSLCLIFGTLISATGRLIGISSEYILYFFLSSIAIEVFIFSIGLSYKYRLSEKMERDSRNKLILQLQENEQLQKKVNLELEDKVKERTIVISKQKDEIDTLYREVNHRIKNNFAIILGILENQIDNTKVPEIKEALINASSRINSMSLIHDLIHRNYSSTAILAKEYIHQLANYIIGLKSEHTDVRAVITCPDDLLIGMQVSVALGTIVNELILNSIKHAKNETGDIECQLGINNVDNFLQLKYSDNGSEKIPANVLKKKDCIGMYLIETMTKQMDGQLNLNLENGFVAELSLKLQE